MPNSRENFHNYAMQTIAVISFLFLHVKKVPGHAFVNGIEILFMPTNFYVRGDGYDIKLVGQNNLYYINNSTALETLYRLNVGANLVPSTRDMGMYRVWVADDIFVVGYDHQTSYLDVNITYSSETQTYTSLIIVYTTSRTIANNSRSLD
ncbi:hypothetical protein BC332_20449 [Capsicum chinense]|nr:hypothetical protein BC332_20449 [Capsicum chinense]